MTTTGVNVADVLGGLVALGLLIYLIVTLVRPERF